MNSPLFLVTSIKNLALRTHVGGNEELLAEILIGTTKNVFTWPFVDLMVQCIHNNFDGILMRIKTKNKALGFTIVNVPKDVDFITSDCVLFVENEGNQQKTVAGTLTVEFTKKTFEIFKKEKEEVDLFTFTSEEFSGILTFFRQEIEPCQQELNKFELDLDLEKGSETFKRKLKKVKYLLTGVNGKLKVLDILREDRMKLLVESDQKDQKIEELEKKLLKNSQFYLESKDEFKDQITNQSVKIQELIQDIEGLKETITNISSQNLIYQTEISFLKADHTKFYDQHRLFTDTEKFIKELQVTIEQKEAASFKHFAETEALQKSYINVLEEHQETINSLITENTSLSNQVSSLTESLNSLKNESESLKSELNYLQSMLKDNISLETIIKDLENKSKEYENSSKSFKQQSLELKDRMENIHKRFSDVTREFQKEKLHIHKTAKVLTSDIADLKHKAQAKIVENSNIQAELVHFKSEKFLQRDFKGLELLANRSTLEIGSVILKYKNFETEYKLQTDFLLNSYMSLSQKHLVVQRNLTRIIGLLRDKEKEIPLLREMIAELKSREIYVPINGDIIDNYLANYINSRTEKLEVPFVRLYHGMYLFGSKKVSMKIENSGLVSNF